MVRADARSPRPDPFAEAAKRLTPAPGRLAVYLRVLFEGVPLAGRRMLDVGGGNGAISFYAASRGARVVCLEPGAAGSNAKMRSAFESMAETLRHSVNVELDPRTLQEFQSDSTFDVVLVHNSVNHLNEEACARLHREGWARDAYLELFHKLATLAAPGADLIMSDCSRRNLFGVLGIRNPFVPEIDWAIHQQPSTWAALLKEVGFRYPRTRWNAMTRLGPARRLVSNPIGAFLTTSHFTLNARKA